MINLELPDYLDNLKTQMKGFAEGLLRPIARKYDEAEHTYPVELDVLKGMPVMSRPKKKAGEEKPKKGAERKNGSNMSQAVTVESICWGDVGLMLSIPGAGLGNAAIVAVATDEQMERFGSKWAAMAITEPGSGSDAGSIQTTAVLDGDEWVLNGEKIFVTCADRCDAVVVWANVDPSAGKAGIKSFIVEKGTPGFTLEKLEHKLGIRASDTGTFFLKDCRIPKDNILGSAEVKKSTEGFKGVMKTFDNTRPMVASMSNGVAGASLEFLKQKMEEAGIALDYNENTNNVSAMQKEYYMMEANLEAMRLLTYKASWMADEKIFNNVEASMSKAKAGRAGTLITQKVCELLGSMGFTREHLAEKWMRDSKILDIFEGTGQIQHLIVARNILKLSRNELK
ncbi:acyl-CoA dehydrogenase [Desulfatibacillum alkenivorans DSM 16219]|jgi:acyl-CoA dehydrogenase|uniref:Acyl-CoA dehydrogenase n=1 Tax=Desulfatibacillum alkenivorans DSM 16219 TaxID=1121393 RepID=A0A1M6U3S0_9BACT|nr:acyl-CoA dehydrogenase family protein [Desulfatibacillum alkenivorans]SHK63794.1 acyl-CoA dehydrogenase [Desulfatibacillum alkenivorans DSM 16219]